MTHAACGDTSGSATGFDQGRDHPHIQEPFHVDGSPVPPEAEPVQNAASERGSAGEEAGTSTPVSVADIDEDAALAAATTNAPTVQSPGRAASINLGQLAARNKSDQLLPVSIASRAHSVPARQVPLPPSLRKLAPLQTSSVGTSGTFSRRDFRHS
jgi:hypothetical protein